MSPARKVSLQYREGSFLASLENIRRLGELKGVQIRPHSELTLKSWNNIPTEIRAKVAFGIATYEKVLSQASCANEASSFVSLEAEKEYLSLALDMLDLESPEDFISTLSVGDIIEIYNAEGIQIYRNFAFFEKCSYSLLDLLTYEWHILYERNQTVTDAILSRVKEVIASGTKTEPFGIPDHSLREKYLEANKVFAMHLKQISPVKNKFTGKNAAEIHSLTADIVAYGPDSKKIAYLRS